MKIVAEQTRFHRFAWYFEYKPERIEFARTLKESFGWQNFSFVSEGAKKCWAFSQIQILETLLGMYPQVELDPKVKLIMAAESASMREKQLRTEAISDIKQKTDTDFKVRGLKGELYPYQKIGVEFLVNAGGRAMNNDPMGLGKSCMTIAYIKYMGFQRTLVVAPASIKAVWRNEVSKWTNLSTCVIDSKTDLRDIPSDVNVWIINYELLKKNLPELLKTRFDCLVADESHYAKSPKSIRTKALRQLSRAIHGLILLTGTPIMNRPIELWSLLNMIDPKEWGNYYDFARRYADMKRTRWGMDVSGSSNIDELSERIKRYFIRRKKEDVLSELPPKVFTDIPVTLDQDTQEQYDVAEENLAEYMSTFAGKQPKDVAKMLNAEKLTRINVLRALASDGKRAICTDIIDSVVSSGEKVLVFASFKKPLESLLSHYGDSAVLITGDTSLEDREAAVSAFQNDPRVTVFLGGYKSAGVGLTLTEAQTVICLDLPWTPGDLDQAIDRAHRIGSKHSSINVFRLMAEGTLDSKMAKMLDKKRSISERVLEGGVEKEDDYVNEMISEIVSRQEKNKH